MRYNQFGNTGLFVSEICLGAMTFGSSAQDTMWGQIAGLDQDGVDRIVERALAAGVNFIDTANVYSGGESERLLGQSLRNLGVRRSDVVIATKAFIRMGPGPNDAGASRGHLMDAVQQSLDRLQTDHIDLYQIHGNDSVTGIDETLRALDDLVSRGLVRYIGVSNWAAWKMMKALGISERRGFARFESVQAYYSIAGRDLEREIVPFIEFEKMGLMVWSPLAGGLLSGKYGPGSSEGEGRRASFDFPPVDRDRADRAIAVMREVAAAHGVTVAQVALAWILAKPFVTSVIIGAKRLDQLDDNLSASALTLTGEDMARLDAVSALPEEYPGWMLSRQGSGRIPTPFTPVA
ncbi:aldo/keto reductase [Sphingomonas colocasiae]|uniref:Aldo/keto reductase n=1 Tax=Sphingomonas colocasiae TaxID=1848973 RepID=A0ABS7PN60_9SPHN|nr:aldo/keto reductase [Sphingomonas colocasiae]MBY8822663.1 aldo/keto reductase [Sphingomonas colocasiae]